MLLWGVAPAWAQDTQSFEPNYPDRRKPQFTQEFGYALIPFPYKLQGLGAGYGLAGGAMNIAGTATDVFGAVFTGDVQGSALGVADINLVPRTLILDLGLAKMNKISLQSYSQRGMNTDKRDYRLMEIGDSEYYGARMTATFLERRLELYGSWYEGAARLDSIRDSDGVLIARTQNAPRSHGITTRLGTRLDLTDDYADPRRGLRLDITRSWSLPNGSGADYYVMDYGASAYVPWGARSTWVFNLLRSDAIVSRQGQIDPAALQQELGLNCASIPDPTQALYCKQVIDNMVAEHSYGTASALGGFSRLRSYSQGRYKGAHTLFFGSEIRWNLTEERKPFDIGIMKDVRTLMQLALFYEAGVTSDTLSDLSDHGMLRKTTGFGFRIVTAAGFVFRADMGYGSDGPGAAVFVGYPWELQ